MTQAHNDPVTQRYIDNRQRRTELAGQILATPVDNQGHQVSPSPEEFAAARRDELDAAIKRVDELRDAL